MWTHNPTVNCKLWQSKTAIRHLHWRLARAPTRIADRAGTVFAADRYQMDYRDRSPNTRRPTRAPASRGRSPALSPTGVRSIKSPARCASGSPAPPRPRRREFISRAASAGLRVSARTVAAPGRQRLRRRRRRHAGRAARRSEPSPRTAPARRRAAAPHSQHLH